MKQNFAESLQEVLKHEGGFVDDPKDPGGPTNRGVTQHVYDDWRVKQGLAKRSVKFINDYEVACIYKKLYWDAAQCDELPSGLDYCVFDFAVNSGVNRACRYIQRIASVHEDGVIGPETLKALSTLGLVAVIVAYCALHQKFLEQLSTYTRFGDGWEQRVKDVQTLAKQMAA